jgi:mono/diheme cytochrome c family protein
MKKLSLALLGSVLVVCTMGFARMGGWAVVSVEKIPDHWVTNKPLQLAFSVRQHGMNKLTDLTPIVEARSGSRVVKGVTWKFAETNGYRARIAFPQPGDWQVTINSGFGRSRAVLIPWRVVDSTSPAPADFSDVERGRRMFAAKGCVTCHVHGSVDIAGDLKDFGPNLTDRRFPAEYLAAFLADPSIKPPTDANKRMPNLALNPKDIAVLVAFINSERRLSSNR